MTQLVNSKPASKLAAPIKIIMDLRALAEYEIILLKLSIKTDFKTARIILYFNTRTI